MNYNESLEQLQIINSVFQNPVDTYESRYEALWDLLHEPVAKCPLLKTPLLPHQVRMVKAMHAYCHAMRGGHTPEGSVHHLKGKIGVVGDMAGSGKTLSVLGFLASQRPVVPSSSNNSSSEYVLESNRFFFSHTVKPLQDASAVSLVIVPPHLLQQWRDETAKHTHLTPFVIDSRRLLRNRTTPDLIRQSSFVLTTSKLYKDVHEYLVLQTIGLQYVCFDEAANLYLGPNDPVPVAEFIWLISSQWLCFLFKNAYLNNTALASFRSQVQLHKDAVKWLDAIQKNDVMITTAIEGSSFFKHLLPFQHPCRGSMILRNSTHLVLPDLREQTIPCSVKLTLASIPPSLLQNQFEGLTHERIPTLFQALDIPSLTFDQLVSHHSERSSLLQSKKEDVCSICLESPQNKVFLSCCMNVFCGACILRQLLTHPQCPTCRALLFLPNMLSIRDSLAGVQELETRPEACVSYILANPAGSHVVYTPFENTFYQIQHTLSKYGIYCEHLDSNPGKMYRTIANFNRGTTKVLVVSNLKHIQGVTLSKASHLIFFYELPFYGQGQTMIHSAQRLGRVEPLTLVHLRGGLD